MGTRKESMMAEPISKEELEALHTPEVIAQIQEALEADERGEGRRMTKEELEAAIKSNIPAWMPTKAEMEAVYPEELEYTGRYIDDVIAEHDRRKAMLVARKLVEHVDKKIQSIRCRNGVFKQEFIDFWQQLRKEVLDG